MKMTFTPLLLFVGWSSFADAARVDPAYLNNGVYTQEADEDLTSEGVYNGEIDEPSIIQTQAVMSNAALCTRNTGVGVGCVCNHGVFRGRDNERPGWHFDGRHSIRDGWYATYLKGTHTAICYRDQ
jgi:hypothetical protein